MKLSDQIAVIVGGARGIGEAIAHTFAGEGAKIVLVDLEKMEPELDGVVQAIGQKGGEAVAMTADATDAAQIDKMVADVAAKWGRLDILVNSVGFRGPMVEVHEITEEEWDQVLNVNLKAIFLCCKAALPVMMGQKRGSIVSISGTAGREGMALRGSLCAAKWGLLGLTQTIAKEAGPSGVRANVICPGGMDEADLREMYHDRAKGLGVSFEELWENVLKQTPLRKHALHEEVANAALFLASSDSSHTTGEALNVSGGRLMS